MTKELIEEARDRTAHMKLLAKVTENSPGAVRALEEADRMTRFADALEAALAARQPTEDDREALARVMDTLAYYHCRSVNPKADHPRMGYHAMTEDQREHLRERQREAAEEIVRMIPSLSRAAVPDAATDWQKIAVEQTRLERGRAEQAEAERDAALAAIERVEALTSRAQTFGADEFGAFKRELLAAIDGAPEPEETEWVYRARNSILNSDAHVSEEAARATLQLMIENHPFEVEPEPVFIERRPRFAWLPVEGDKS